MDFTISTRAAENRKIEKGVVAQSSTVALQVYGAD